MTAARSPRAMLALAFGLLINWSSPPSIARACMCAEMDMATARERATHVFEGTLVRYVAATQHIVFDVDRVWKGRVGRTIEVSYPMPQLLSCPPDLMVGHHYIIYTHAIDPADTPRIGACWRYVEGPYVAAERRALGVPLRTWRSGGERAR